MDSIVFEVHFCLVGSNSIANATPVLDLRFRPKQLVLLEPDGLQKYGDSLLSIYQDIGVFCRRVGLGEATDFERTRLLISDLLAEYAADSVVLNVSCGHRLLMLAAFTAFQQAGQPVFYVNPENDHLTWLAPADRASVDLADHLNIEQFLHLQGTQLISRVSEPVSDLFDPVFDALLAQITRFSRPFKVVNALAASARFSTTLSSQPFTPEQLYNNALQDLVDVFVNYECCYRQGDTLVFINEAARNFVNGGWLELFACRELQRMAQDCSQIQDIAYNVEIRRGEGGNVVNNELDVVFMADNRLYFIECKTMDFAAVKGRLPRKKVKEKRRAAREQVYRMDSLIDQHAGFHGDAMLISYHPLPPEVLQRADDLGVLVCCAEDLKDFSVYIQRWSLK